MSHKTRCKSSFKIQKRDLNSLKKFGPCVKVKGYWKLKKNNA